MKDNIQITLKYCLEIARRGDSKISVFDLLYETGFAYPELKSALDSLAERKLIAWVDDKTVEYIGEDKGEEVRLSEIDALLENIKITDENFLSVLDECFEGLSEIKQMIDYKKLQGNVDGEELKKCEQILNGHYARLDKLREQYVKGKQDRANGSNAIDDTYIQVLGFCARYQQASASLIQRRFPVGYIKACKMVDWMESMGYITPPDGCKPRQVLIDYEEFERLYGGTFDNKAFELGELFKEDHENDGDDDDDDDFDDFDIDSLFKPDGAAEQEDEDEEDEDLKPNCVVRDPAEDMAELIARELRGNFTWGKYHNGVLVYSDSFKYSTGDTVEIRIVCKEEGVFLSDDGYARNKLAAKPRSGACRADNKIEKYVQGKRVKYLDGELQIEANVYTIFSDFIYLYAVVEGLLAA